MQMRFQLGFCLTTEYFLKYLTLSVKLPSMTDFSELRNEDILLPNADALMDATEGLKYEEAGILNEVLKACH